MRQETEPLPRRTRPLPEVAPEEELDIGRYWRSVVTRWWLVAAAVALGVVVGYLLAVGGGDVWRARATLYLGQPIAPSGEAGIQSAATNPATAGQIARSDEVVEEVAAQTGVSPGKLRAGISTKAVEGAITRLGQTPLVVVSVRGPWGRETVSRAANLLAAATAERVSAGYVEGKIAALEEQVGAQEEEIAAVERQIETLQAEIARGEGLSASERLALVSLVALAEQRRGDLVTERAETRQELAVAQNVERSSVLTEARATKVSARSASSSILVGGLIGLLAGVGLALFWKPLTRRVRPADT